MSGEPLKQEERRRRPNHGRVHRGGGNGCGTLPRDSSSTPPAGQSVYGRHDVRSQLPPQPSQNRPGSGGDEQEVASPQIQPHSSRETPPVRPVRVSEQPGSWGRVNTDAGEDGHKARQAVVSQEGKMSVTGGNSPAQGGKAHSRGAGHSGGSRHVRTASEDARAGGASSADRHQDARNASDESGPGASDDVCKGLEDGKREQGFVVSVRDSFGFISCLSNSGEVFFHISEVQTRKDGGRDHSRQHLSQLISEGDEVDFVLALNPRSKKPNAKQIKVLPSGTIKVETVGKQILKAQVTQDAQSTARRDDATGMLKVTGVADDQPECVDDGPTASAGDSLLFSLSEVEGGKNPAVGSEVECLVSVHKRSKHKRAVAVKVISAAGGGQSDKLWSDGKASGGKDKRTTKVPAVKAGKRMTGVVVSLKEAYGFIQPLQLDVAQIFFHYSELPVGARPVLGSAVEYEVQFSQRTKRDVAVNVILLQEEIVLLGPSQTVQGIVSMRATEKGSGMLLFTDKHLCEQTCSYDGTVVNRNSATDTDEAMPLETDDEVEFEARMNIATCEYTASAVRLLRRSQERIEYGSVNTLKGNFGFIKSCSRALDIFFHLSSLQEGLTPETVTVGTEVQYRVSRDKKSGKLNAVDVRPAPPGCVVFEEVGEEELTGTVTERSISMGSGGVAIGVIEYDDASATNKSSRITFYPPDVVGISPKIGDPVIFKVATNLRAARDAQLVKSIAAQNGARRAVHVSLVRHTGRVAAIRASFGFIEYSPHPINTVLATQWKFDTRAKAPPGLTPVCSISDRESAEKGKTLERITYPDVASCSLVQRESGKHDDAKGATREDKEKNAESGADDEKTVRAYEDGKEESFHGVEGMANLDQGRKADGEAGLATEDGEKGNARGDADVEATEGETVISEAEVVSAAPPAVLGDEAVAIISNNEEDAAGGEGETACAARIDAEGRAGSGTDTAKSRIFFHFTEVQNNVMLGVNDEVEFTVFMNPKNMQLNARHIVRTKVAVAGASRVGSSRPDRLLELVAPLKHTPIKPGQPIRHQGVRQPLMPDGTRGFTYSREKSLQGVLHHPPLGLRPPPLQQPQPEPELPARQGSKVSLNVDAAPFIPTFH